MGTAKCGCWSTVYHPSRKSSYALHKYEEKTKTRTKQKSKYNIPLLDEKYERSRTNGPRTDDYRFRPMSFAVLCRPTRNLTGPVDPTRVKPVFHGSIGIWRVGSSQVGSGGVQDITGRVGSSREFFESHESGRVGSDWVRSGQGFLVSRGSGRVGSGGVRNLACRVGSGQQV